MADEDVVVNAGPGAGAAEVLESMGDPPAPAADPFEDTPPADADVPAGEDKGAPPPAEGDVPEADGAAPTGKPGEADDAAEAGKPAAWNPDGRLLMEAARLGVPYEDAMAAGTDGALGAMLRVLKARLPADGGSPAAAAKPADAGKPAEGLLNAEELLKEWPTLKTEDGFDEKLVAATEAQKAAVVKVIDKLNAGFEKLNMGTVSAQHSLEVRGFDDMVNRLEDATLKKVYGEGYAEELPEESYKAREALFDRFYALKEEARAKGLKTPSRELLEQALAIQHPGEMKKSVLRTAAEAAKKRHKLRVPGAPRPSGGHLTSEEEAVADIAEGIAELKRRGK